MSHIEIVSKSKDLDLLRAVPYAYDWVATSIAAGSSVELVRHFFGELFDNNCLERIVEGSALER